MKLEHFLQHHGIAGNPFAEEDAQTDTVFKRRCLSDGSPSRVEQVLRQSGRPVDGPGLRRKGERQDGPSAPGRIRARVAQSSEPGRARFRDLVRRFQPYLDNCKTAIGASEHGRRPREVAARGPHGRDPVAGGDQARRSVDRREDQPHDAQRGPATRSLAAGRALRRLDKSADREALEPAPSPIRLSPALVAPRLADRFRHDPGRDRAHRDLPVAHQPQDHFPGCSSRSWPDGFTGAGG